MLSKRISSLLSAPILQRPMFSSAAEFSIPRSSAENPVTLGKLADNPGARVKKTRVGRGPGSGLGKSAGRGMCGQRAREGGRRTNIFEGGQMPIFRKLPLIGFNARNPVEYKPLNLHKLVAAIETGLIDATQPIDMKAIYDANLVGKIDQGVKLLSTGAEDFNLRNLHIRVSAVSAKAKAAIESLGGKVETVYYNTLGLRALLQPEKFDTLPLNARPQQRLAAKFDTPQPFPAAPQRTLRVPLNKQQQQQQKL